MHIECATIYELYVSLLMPLSLAFSAHTHPQLTWDSHAFFEGMTNRTQPSDPNGRLSFRGRMLFFSLQLGLS